MNSRPLFSILIPSLNGGHYLRSAVESVLGIKYLDFELVVTLNGVENSDRDWLSKIKDSRLIVYETEDLLPMTANFNFAIEKARGEYVTVLGDDDGVMPWFFDRMEDLILAHPNAPVFSFRRAYFFWPGFPRVDHHYRIIYLSRKKTVMRTTRFLPQLMMLGFKEHWDSPQMYTNNVWRREALSNLFLSQDKGALRYVAPDNYSAALSSTQLSYFCFSSDPLFWTGSSSKSSVMTEARTEDFEQMSNFFKLSYSYGFTVSEVIGWRLLQACPTTPISMFACFVELGFFRTPYKLLIWKFLCVLSGVAALIPSMVATTRGRRQILYACKLGWSSLCYPRWSYGPVVLVFTLVFVPIACAIAFGRRLQSMVRYFTYGWFGTTKLLLRRQHLAENIESANRYVRSVSSST